MFIRKMIPFSLQLAVLLQVFLMFSLKFSFVQFTLILWYTVLKATFICLFTQGLLAPLQHIWTSALLN